ncbi:MAG: hypothetical protein WB992_02190 [Bryobacteraceae bacterium]
MAADCAAIFEAFCLFSLVSFIPGYALGWLLDTMRFRARTLYCRFALSLPLSIAVGPVIVYFVGRWLSMPVVCALYGVLCLFTLFLFLRGLKNGRLRPTRPTRTQCLVLGVVGIWIAIAVLSLMDLQIGRRLYFSMIGFDYSVRTAFTSAISAFGLPPQNPFFFPGHPVVLRYHYFWLMLPALVHQISGSLVDARQALIGATIWCGIGFMCVIALYLRFFSASLSADIAKRALIGVLLLGVTGLDILPTLFLLWVRTQGARIPILPSVEWWNNQVDGWMFTMLWEPHALSSLLACLMGFLILWDVAEQTGKRRLVSSVTAGVCFATGVGASIYVAFVFAVFLLCWTLITVWKKWHRETLALALSGVVAGALSIPFLISLRGPGSGGAPVQLTFRDFFFVQIFLKALAVSYPSRMLANVVLLPVNYFLELGFFGVAGWIVWKRFRAGKRACMRHELAGFTMICASVAACTFLKSGVIENNDLGWRGFLIAQFILLIWAADLLTGFNVSSRIAKGPKDLLIAVLILGAAGVAYDLAMLRFFPLLSDAAIVPKISWLANDEKLGSRTYANREAHEWLRARTAVEAIVQQNPRVTIQDSFYGLYANRRTVAEDSSCGTVFGGDPRQCGPISAILAALFSEGDGSSSQSFLLACRSLPIDYFVAKDTDQAWNDPDSWVWTRPPIFANDFVRLFACPR